MKTILLINDDGIQSTSLLALKQKLDKFGKVVVIAPQTHNAYQNRLQHDKKALNNMLTSIFSNALARLDSG